MQPPLPDLWSSPSEHSYYLCVMTSAALSSSPARPARRSAVFGARLKADTLLYVALLFTWVSIWRIQDIITILGKMKFAVIVEVLAIALFVADATPSRKLKWINSRVIALILAIFGLMIVSLPWSLWAGKGVNFMIFDFMPTFVMMLLIATIVREHADLEWLAFAHLIGGTIYAVYVYLFCPMTAGGRLGSLVFYDANDFALVMVCTIPFAIYFLRPGVNATRRLIALMSVGLFAIMIIKSGSRGGFVGLMVVVAYILLQYRSVPTRLRLGAVGAMVAVFALFGSAKYWEMMQTMTNMEDDYNMTSKTGRKAVWNRGLGYITMRPVTGVGIRAFPQAEGKISPLAIEYAERGRGIKWSVAHNSYIEIGAECGAIALVLFPAMLFMAGGTLYRVRSRGPDDYIVAPNDAAFAQTLLASLIGFATCGFFLSGEYFPYLYLLLGFTVGQQAIFRRRAENPPRNTTPAAVHAPRPARRIRAPWAPVST
jgi:O-antigen ligase